MLALSVGPSRVDVPRPTSNDVAARRPLLAAGILEAETPAAIAREEGVSRQAI